MLRPMLTAPKAAKAGSKDFTESPTVIKALAKSRLILIKF